MGHKKSGGKEEDADNSTKDMLVVYKKQIKENEAVISKVLEAKLLEAYNNEVHLP